MLTLFLIITGEKDQGLDLTLPVIWPVNDLSGVNLWYKMSNTDYYKSLGVNRNATDSEIKKA